MSDGLDRKPISADRWGYTAAAMAEHLVLVIDKGRTQPSTLPHGVSVSAKQFFDRAIQGAESGTIDWDARDIYRIACDVLKGCELPEAWLPGISSLLPRLEVEHELTMEEVALARNLHTFFERLGKLGDEAAYDEHMQGSHAHFPKPSLQEDE